MTCSTSTWPACLPPSRPSTRCSRFAPSPSHRGDGKLRHNTSFASQSVLSLTLHLQYRNTTSGTLHGQPAMVPPATVLTSSCVSSPPQKKEKGRKTVLAMSSGAAVMSRASKASRDPDTPLNFADGIMIAYKASKSALNQGAPGTCGRGQEGSRSNGHQANDALRPSCFSDGQQQLRHAERLAACAVALRVCCCTCANIPASAPWHPVAVPSQFDKYASVVHSDGAAGADAEGGGIHLHRAASRCVSSAQRPDQTQPTGLPSDSAMDGGNLRST